MKIQLACTPNADDAYMLWALSTGRVRGEGFELEVLEASLPTLNDRASRAQHDVTMVSAAAVALLGERYAILPAGSSFGLGGVGPVIVARESFAPGDLAGRSVAIPGATTTAYAMLQLYQPTLRTQVLPFNKLLPAVEMGLVDAALLIHEEFVTYRQYGLEVVVDLGAWWAEQFDELPMPVTCCLARRDLPAELRSRLPGLIAESIRTAREHHDEALAHAARYAPGCERSAVETFIRQYVNELSGDLGETGRAALERFFEATEKAGILPSALPLEIETARR